MQVTETSSEGLKRELQIVIAAAELDNKLNEKLNEVKDKVQLKGFRPGKVPPAHIKKIYGKSMMAEIIQETVSDTSRDALVERDERPAFQPDIKMTEDEKEIEEIMSGQADLSYTMSFEILPTVEPMDFKKVKLDRSVAKIDDDEVEKRLDELVKSSATYEAREGRTAEIDDQVKIDFVGTMDGEEFEGGKAEDAPLVLGSNSFIPGFEEALLGSKAGEDRKVEVTFPEDYNAAHLAGKDVVFQVKISEVSEPVLPDIDDEFAKKLGLENLEKLKDAIKDQIKEQYQHYSDARIKKLLLDVLSDGHKFELPPSLVESEFEAIWKQLADSLEKAGKTFEDEGKTEAETRKEYNEIAQRRVRLGIVLSHIGEQVKISVSDEEMQQALAEQSRQFPGQEQLLYDFYRKNPNALSEIRAPIYEDKVVNYILELADVTEVEITPEELMKPDEDEDLEHQHDENCDHNHDHD